MHSENAGSSIQIWAPYSINGSAGEAFTLGTGGLILVSKGVGTIEGNLTFTQFIFSRSGEIRFNINPAFSVSSGSSVTGYPFILYANAVIETGGVTTPGYIPGSRLGILGSGSRYHGPLLTCVGGSSGCPETSAPTGLGTGGSVTLTPGADERSGEFILTAGTGAATSGQFNLSFGVLLQSNGSEPASCTISFIGGTTGYWAASAVLKTGINSSIHSSPSAMPVYWSNLGVHLTAGATYGGNYVCDGGR